MPSVKDHEQRIQAEVLTDKLDNGEPLTGSQNRFMNRFYRNTVRHVESHNSETAPDASLVLLQQRMHVHRAAFGGVFTEDERYERAIAKRDEEEREREERRRTRDDSF